VALMLAGAVTVTTAQAAPVVPLPETLKIAKSQSEFRVERVDAGKAVGRSTLIEHLDVANEAVTNARYCCDPLTAIKLRAEQGPSAVAP
jgi:hypothetical protein